MRDSSPRLGALAGQWDVPDSADLKARLRPEPDVAHRFHERSLLSSGRDSSGERSAAEFGNDERGGD